VCQQLADGTYEPITVLEAVVRQTGIYASSRSGRLSVFWGDQIFIPTSPFVYTPTHHVDIMCTLEQEPPTAQIWKEKGLEKYGVIAVSGGDSGDAAQVEKVDHATAMRMLKNLGDIGRVGPSLGSFSVSAKILQALCEEFKTELAAKDGKLDTGKYVVMDLCGTHLKTNRSYRTVYTRLVMPIFPSTTRQIHTFGCLSLFPKMNTSLSCRKREWNMTNLARTMYA
jgi:hypothetical protein